MDMSCWRLGSLLAVCLGLGCTVIAQNPVPLVQAQPRLQAPGTTSGARAGREGRQKAAPRSSVQHDAELPGPRPPEGPAGPLAAPPAPAAPAVDKPQDLEALLAEGQRLLEDAPLPTALSTFERAFDLARRTGNRAAEVTARHGLGRASIALPARVAHYRVGLDLARALHDRQAEAALLTSLGEAYQEAGFPPITQRWLTEALALWQTLGERQAVANTYTWLGLSARLQGLYEEALTHFEAAQTFWAPDGPGLPRAQGLLQIAKLHVRLGADEKAGVALRQAGDVLQPLLQPQASKALAIAMERGISGLSEEMRQDMYRRQKDGSLYRQEKPLPPPLSSTNEQFQRYQHDALAELQDSPPRRAARAGARRAPPRATADRRDPNAHPSAGPLPAAAPGGAS